ncbi:hypothetical protein [Actinocorallia sp. A-T 12471]|uniref:hypothetical protein n=1 Tax=Actinocorallia sp. A-T 12471 TaxID=3089813 RepID=UPI0029CF1BC3|nr:hypothetical protein [Actinocorallia sp. A-T 12471]MDX6742495.1 hypothetical protein [Actinocorallia sp. A-T 12471]
MAHHIMISFESGERQSLYLADWADAPLRDFVDDLERSDHVHGVKVLQGPRPQVMPVAPYQGDLAPLETAVPSVREAAGRIFAAVTGSLLTLIGLLFMFGFGALDAQSRLNGLALVVPGLLLLSTTIPFRRP